MKAIIRLARYREIHWIVDILADIQEEWGESCPEIIEPIIYHQMTKLIAAGLVSVAIVKHNDQPKLVGVSSIDTSHFPWNPKYEFYVPLYFGVMRNFRNSNIGSLLFDDMVEMAHRNGGDLMFSHLTPIEPELKDKLAERKGGERRGSFYWFPLNRSDPEPMEN